LEGSIEKAPKPKGWTYSKCLQFLMEHPITGAEEIAFLHKKAQEVIQVVKEASPPKADDDETVGRKWVGQLPYLRLIHCLLEDDIQEKWIHRNDPLSIQQIDARNSTARAENVYELLARRWNNELFNPTTTVSNCHVDFAEEIDIGYQQSTVDFVRAIHSTNTTLKACLRTSGELPRKFPLCIMIPWKT
jgi:hypothetical protein